MQIAELVATEFFEQGDKERSELNIEPSVSATCPIVVNVLWNFARFLFFIFQDLMNREKRDKIPSMQVSFIDAICVQLYEASSFKFS